MRHSIGAIKNRFKANLRKVAGVVCMPLITDGIIADANIFKINDLLALFLVQRDVPGHARQIGLG